MYVLKLKCYAACYDSVSFEYILSPDETYGSFRNGSWNGMVGMLVRGVPQLIFTIVLTVDSTSLFKTPNI